MKKKENNGYRLVPTCDSCAHMVHRITQGMRIRYCAERGAVVGLGRICTLYRRGVNPDKYSKASKERY